MFILSYFILWEKNEMENVGDHSVLQELAYSS